MAIAGHPLAALDTIFFSRNFPGSGPAYFEVQIDSEGKGSYKEAPDEEPLLFTLSDETKNWVFAKAAALDRFNRTLASTRKVAGTGARILRCETDGAPQGEAKFAYTDDETASELVTWFLHVSETERYYIDLERALQFDRLGVNDALLNLHAAYDKGRIIAPEQFLPILRKVVDQQKIMHVARSRASALIEQISAPAKQ
jgi:hypothetical protein